MHPVLSLVLGLVCAGLGGELFVRGAVGLASWARVPAGVIGATVAAFATSSPELSVSISSSLAGAPQIALGDALGSNVVNVALVLGLALLFGPMKGGGVGERRNAWVALGAPAATALLLLDGEMSRLDAGVLLAAFVVWLGWTVTEAIRQRDYSAEVLGEPGHGLALLWSVLGLGLLILAGGLIVDGAKFVGTQLGMNAFVVGATLVAIGTSAPELATTLIARWKGHDEVGLGTIFGSNLFNGLFIVAVAGLIRPFEVGVLDVLVGLVCGLASVAVVAPWGGSGVLNRQKGIFLVSLYVGYVVALVATGSGGG